MGNSGQLLPVATPRLGFQGVDPIGHLLDEHLDQFTEIGIGGQME